MKYNEVKEEIKELRNNLCSMCCDDILTEYKPNCRKIGNKHDCKPQAILDRFEKELTSHCD